MVRALDPARTSRCSPTASELPYDLFLGIPKHACPPVVAASGHVRRRVDPGRPRSRSRRAFADVYAVGDVTSVGTPKAGVFAEGQAAVVADEIIARVRGGADADTYDGHGVCYIEFGDGQVGRSTSTSSPGSRRAGRSPRRREAVTAGERSFASSASRSFGTSSRFFTGADAYDRPWALTWSPRAAVRDLAGVTAGLDVSTSAADRAPHGELVARVGTDH